MSYKPLYRIIGAYDSETANVRVDGEPKAYPILHQLGVLDCEVQALTPSNVESHVDIRLYRNCIDLYAALDVISDDVQAYVPVIVCHNLAFDMYGLSRWLDGKRVKVLAKSCVKPISFTILDEEGNARLVLWDTLVFSGQTLARMGEDAGYSKLVGEWDYKLVRTPETPLSDHEIAYAKHDIYALLCWLSYWLRVNSDINATDLACSVVTKTGVVRKRRLQDFYRLQGEKLKRDVGTYWMQLNATQAPSTDDELYTMLACTRGALTFCASKRASVPYDLHGTSERVFGFDATSQHPAQMVSHKYPVDFKSASPELLQLAYRVIEKVSVDDVLNRWQKPFSVAFNAAFRFTNLRVKAGSIYARDGIVPLASSRVKPVDKDLYCEDSEAKYDYDALMEELGYKDTAINPVFTFGKLVSCDSCILFLTELAAWEVCECYEFDSVQAIGGYLTQRFVKPSDMSVISVMRFYQKKNEFKKARESYYETGTISNGKRLREHGISNAVVEGMERGTLEDSEVENTYLRIKADLNALFGIEACNEYRRDTVLTNLGIAYSGDMGITCKPKKPKTWYQFGQRIVGWSRIAQLCAIELIGSCDSAVIINGDTDSIKVKAPASMLPDIQANLHKLASAIDKGKDSVCIRVKRNYRDYYDPLNCIGYYVLEFETKRFCASWNKAYCMEQYDKRTGKHVLKFTIAGIPTRDVNALAQRYMDAGATFADICNVFLGYNVTYSYGITHLNQRTPPEWGEVFNGRVTDYAGNTYRVCECSAMALFPMSKTVNDTTKPDNKRNLRQAMQNNPNVNIQSLIIGKERVYEHDENGRPREHETLRLG